jgi:hypothetical protein
MPLARIDLRKGKSADYLQRVGETIYQAMRAWACRRTTASRSSRNTRPAR